ncbi:helix-turn-helix domain-containing protein [Enterococcus gallinarum]|uniref:helix-turn-helix domain-containing protein n=1 Tax=Enterococcus gallinarum TaxID=1353 RepID=UPI001E5EFA9A|nr:helix-turn-helix transcriptional regulator [Enterococcus gallinarum]MCD5076623.1 helix-turn-helix transcriptional regulator [Enterococcus gallinarum]MDL4908391.1 helix-turn-helix transcriptional regulator [Enterococcus gallinarum]MEB5857671.1 helix-turn-helix domain-containing protein [Enterococcus gallinarum]
MKTLDKSNLAKRLEQLRENNGWTKTLVANKLGLKNMATYANWEYGTREPDNQSLLDLAAIYGVTVDYLLTGEEGHQKEASKTFDETNDMIRTVAAHIDDNATEEDLEDILRYIEYRKNNPLQKKK